jgi:hypothetical protein
MSQKNKSYTMNVIKGYPFLVIFKGMFLVDGWQYNGDLRYSTTDNGKNWLLNGWNLTEPDDGGMREFRTNVLPKSLDPLLRKDLSLLLIQNDFDKEISDIETRLKLLRLQISNLEAELEIKKSRR